MNRRGMRTVEVDENRRELSPHGTLMLPLQINHDDQYLEEYRVAQGLALLQQGEMSVTEIALHCGFSNAGRFSAAFCRRMHCTPREYLSRCRSGPT